MSPGTATAVDDHLERGTPMVQRVARRMSSTMRDGPAATDLSWVGMATLFDAACCHDPSRLQFAPYLLARLRWAMMSEARRCRRRAQLLARFGIPQSSIPASAEALADGLARATDDREDDSTEALVSESDNPEDALQRTQMRHRLLKALAALPATVRMVLVRHYYGEERLHLLAEELGISRATATRLHLHGTRLLARHLRDFAPDA